MENYLSISASFSLYVFGSYQSVHARARQAHIHNSKYVYTYTLLRENDTS